MTREQDLIQETIARIDAMENRHSVVCADLVYRDMRFQAALDAGTLAGAALVQKEREINAFLVEFPGVSERSGEDLMQQMSREELTQQVNKEDMMHQVSRADTMRQVSREDMMRQVRKEAQPVTDLLATLKEDLRVEIKKRQTGLWHVTDQKNLKTIRASEKRMTMYRNDYLSAVFATSDERQKLLYAARAAGGGMTVDDEIGVCRFDTEPFVSHAGDICTLKKTAYAYELDPEPFEPVIDFLSEKDGHARIFYGSEWVCRSGSVPVQGCHEITQIDVRKLGENMQIR